MKLNHGSLFSGIGGFDLAAEWMGWENVFHCEWNEFGKRVLNYYWPNAESFSDITKTDFTKYANKIDILTGGFPCQPYSTAGKRLGTEDDRHLWPEMLRAIREIQPRYIVGENVYGLINWDGGLVFNEVQTDLESEGYEVQPVILPACGKGAPHRRERVWFVAYSDKCTTRPPRASSRIIGQGRNNNDEPGKRREQTEQHIGCSYVPRNDTDPTNPGIEGLQQGRKNRIYESGITADTQSSNKQRKRICEISQEKKIRGCSFVQNGFENFPTKSPICSGDDGVSSGLDGITFPKWRNESIKGYGNAIVPQVAFEIFKAIQSSDNIL